jgi:ABC-2 type transport system ATP-binding protein
MRQIMGQQGKAMPEKIDEFIDEISLDTDQPLLSVQQLEKHYPDVKAVNGVSFDLEVGICFGLFGPNGAGKTTTIEMMEGILKPTNGGVYFRGQPINNKYKNRIGILFQQTALQDSLTIKETLQLFQRLYKKNLPIEEVVKSCALQEYLNRDTKKLSGGQRQRLLLAIALINDPDIVFLDEPTTGLDLQARHKFWDLIRGIKQRGKTVVLTTHYRDEAEQLCDEIAIMEAGEIITQDTPKNLLKQNFDGILIRLPKTSHLLTNNEFPLTVKEVGEHVEFTTTDVEQAMKYLMQYHIPLEGLQVTEPNLDDLFLKLTGHSLRS